MDKAARATHPDSNMLISLSREIDRFSDKIDILFTCLKVLGGQDRDIMGAVVAKQLKAAMKEATFEKREKQKEGKAETGQTGASRETGARG